MSLLPRSFLVTKDEVLRCCRDLLKKRNALASRVESIVVEKEELVAMVAESAKVIADLQAQLKESKSKLEKSELKALKERETSKELEEELLAFKKEAMEQHEKGFYKAIM